MRAIVMSVGLSALALAAIPAVAAPEKVDPKDSARATMHIYFDCIVNGARSSRPIKTNMIRYLSVVPGSTEQKEPGLALLKSECLEGVGIDTSLGESYVSQLKFSTVLMRGQMFRALYLDWLKHPKKPVLEPIQIVGGWDIIPRQDQASVLLRFGDCVVAADRPGSEAAIREKPGSVAETAAYRAIAPALNNCLVGTLRFTRVLLESVLAEALYRRATGVVSTALTLATETK